MFIYETLISDAKVYPCLLMLFRWFIQSIKIFSKVTDAMMMMITTISLTALITAESFRMLIKSTQWVSHPSLHQPEMLRFFHALILF